MGRKFFSMHFKVSAVVFIQKGKHKEQNIYGNAGMPFIIVKH